MKKEDFYQTKFWLGKDLLDSHQIQKHLLDLGFEWDFPGASPYAVYNLTQEFLYCNAGKMVYNEFDTCPQWPLKTLEDLRPQEVVVQDLDEMLGHFEKQEAKPYQFSETQFNHLVTELRSAEHCHSAITELLKGLEMTFPDAPIFAKEKTYSIGDRFIYDSGDSPIEEFMLCSTGNKEVGLVSLSKGDLFTVPVYVEDLKAVPLKDLQERLQSAGYDFEKDFTLIPKKDA